MKILIDLRKLSRNPSGIGIYIYRFVKGMINIDSDLQIIGITDVFLSEELLELHEKGVRIISFGKTIDRNFKIISYFSYIQNKIYEIKPDIFWEPNNILPIKIKNPYGTIMTTIHDILPVTLKKYYSLAYRLYFKESLKKTIKYSDLLVYASKYTKSEVEKKFINSKKKDNFVSYNIVKLNGDASKKDIIDKNYFLFIGNVEKRKGVDLLVRAFKLYRDNGGKKELYVAGTLRDKSIKVMIDSVNEKQESIHYMGYISNDEKERLIMECSAFVFPSISEGFGIPPIEAMIYRKPCILSNIEIFNEIFGGNVNYFNIDIDSEKTIKNLRDTLFNYSNFNEEVIDDTIKKYSESNLSKNLLNFIVKSIDKRHYKQ